MTGLLDGTSLLRAVHTGFHVPLRPNVEAVAPPNSGFQAFIFSFFSAGWWS